MKKFNFNRVTRAFHNVGFTFKKHSPEILVAAGVIGAVTSTIMACKATLKLNDILEESKETIDKINEASGAISEEWTYTEEDAKKDLTLVYVQTGLKIAKLYGPAVIVGGLSITSILTSHKILKTRNLALAAAYTTIDNTFKEYRGRVVERFGEAIDRELRYNIVAKEVDVITTDENGEEKVEKRVVNYGKESEYGGYARYFEQYSRDENGKLVPNPNWQSNNEYNLMFLKCQERYANDILQARGRLFLNEVYRMLGIPESQEGQIVGWIYDEANPIGDNYVDFGLFKDQLTFSDFVYGNDNGILLDFNVDGNIWSLMK